MPSFLHTNEKYPHTKEDKSECPLVKLHFI